MKRHLSMRGVLAIGLVVLGHIPVFAQTGPGGVGNSLNNVLWLSADYGVYTDAGLTPASDGNDVRQWNDRSGNNKHAVEVNAGNRPNYETNALNGFPVLRFNAGNDERLLSSGVTTGNNASVWVVARYTSLPSPNPGLICASNTAFPSTATDKNVGMWVNSGSLCPWGRGVQTNGTQRDIPQVINTNANTIYAICSIYGNSSITQYVNGQTGGSATFDGTLKNWSEVGIGRQAAEPWNGDIAEVIIFNTAVNHAQRIIIDNYLAAKYGFTLAANDLYTQDDIGFDYEVAGIGQYDGSNIHNDAQGGIVRINTPSGMENGEYYIWGHDNGPLTPTTSNIPAGVVERLERIWRGTMVGSMSFNVHVDLAGIGNPDVANMRLIVDTNDNGSFADETTGAGGVIAAASVNGTVYTFTGVNLAGRRFTFGTVVTPLPVELVDFKAREDNGQVLLTWSTASENNNSYFTLERSQDGKNFQFLATVEGKGTIDSRTDYSFVDVSPLIGRSYYRLSQIDVDGKRDYFSMVKVDVTEAPTLRVYPNPSNGSFSVTLDHSRDWEPVTVTIHDSRGYQVFSGELPINNQQTSRTLAIVLPDTLQPGIYLVSVIHAGVRHTERVMVRRE
ncbi:MAG: T9SS type A sorting domain-containing protein [Bacteroidota bacterium]|nr:MAG: hypothetical protein DIU61_06990 [Bacteroidota bacterium]